MLDADDFTDGSAAEDFAQAHREVGVEQHVADGEEVAVPFDTGDDLLALLRIRRHRFFQQNGITLWCQQFDRRQVHPVLGADCHRIRHPAGSGQRRVTIETTLRRDAVIRSQTLAQQFPGFGNRHHPELPGMLSGIIGIGFAAFAGTDNGKGNWWVHEETVVKNIRPSGNHAQHFFGPAHSEAAPIIRPLSG
jgi:hypothetical protein